MAKKTNKVTPPNKKGNSLKAKKRDNRLTVLVIIAAVVLLGFSSIFFINKMQNDSKIADSQSTSASNQKTGAKADGSAGSGGYGDYKPKYQATINQLSDKNYQNVILPKDLDKKVKSGEGTFVYFFSPTCVHCHKVTPELMPIADEAGVQIDQYNVLEFEDGWSQYKIDATPSLVYYKDGKEVDRIVGEAPNETFKSFLQDMKD